MTDPAARPPLTDLTDTPPDLEFFFDPACPFAWQTSVWIRRVQELRELTIGWRFISLKFVNAGTDQPEYQVAAHDRGMRFLRVCAAARDVGGNAAVATLYRGWGERYWYGDHGTAPMRERVAAAVRRADPAEIVAAAGLPASLVDAGDDESRDAIIRLETDEALARTGPDVGTPIISYDPPTGSSLFGPVISSVPDDQTAVAIFDAVRTLASFPAFSELKRSARAALDLPLLAERE